MDMYPSFIKEYTEIYSEFSTRKAVIRHLSTLKQLRENAVYWIEGTIISVEKNREFCYLGCRVCNKKVEEVNRQKRCLYCGEFTFTNIYRYNIEAMVADESDTAKLILWNKASEKLIGQPAEDVVGQYGDTTRIMPNEIAEKIVGREGLFELVVTLEGLHVNGFNVSRLTIDDDIKEVYKIRNYPAADPENDSVLGTLDYIEIEDRTSGNNDHTAKDDFEPTTKRHKRE